MWFRSGGDRGNRGVTSTTGPTLARIAWQIALAAPPDGASTQRIAGGAMASDGSMRVVLRGVVFAIDVAERSIRWSRDLRAWFAPVEVDDEGNPFDGVGIVRAASSLPLVLDGDRTVVTAGGQGIVLDARGELVDRIAVPMVDDSGPSPNVTLDGYPIFTTMDGAVHIWEPNGLRTLAPKFGYDIVPVAVFDDGSFGVSGYAGTGYCRAGTAGVAWRSDLEDADMVATIARSQHSAVGSVNERVSGLFDAAGVRIATYPEAAMFAAYDTDWIALSATGLARLSATGEVVWRHALEAVVLRWGCYQPLIDARGTIFIVTGSSIVAYGPDGTPAGALALAEPPMPMIPIAEGMIATLVGDTLVAIT